MLCSLAGLLFTEYRFFKDQTDELLELKEDYRNHLVVVHKVLHEYHKTKERLEELQEQVADKKKSPLTI